MLETAALKATQVLVKKAAPALVKKATRRLVPAAFSSGADSAYMAMVGLAAGAVGVAVMTLSEKIEQSITGRKNSFVPGHTLERMLGQEERPDEERVGHNLAMHWGQGVLIGGVRGWMASRGVNGPMVGLAFWGFRIALDQTLENATGVGELPWRYPKNEQILDAIHKGVFAWTTNAIVEAVAKRAHRT